MLHTDHIIPTFGVYSTEAKVYKISRLLPRKNAKRRLYARVLAPSKDKAIELFLTNTPKEDGSLYTLHTGDWKEDIITNK